MTILLDVNHPAIPKARLFLLLLLILVLPAIGILALIYVDGLLRIVTPIVGFFLAYHFFKFFINHLKSHIRTDETGLAGRTTLGVDIDIKWTDITDAGVLETDAGARTLFLYDDGNDNLLTIPGEYRDWEQLEQEIQSQVAVPFQHIGLGRKDDPRERLRGILAPEPEAPEPKQETPEQTPKENSTEDDG